MSTYKYIIRKMTLVPNKFVKQPAEREYLSIEFEERLVTGDALSSITEAKCYDSSGVDVTSSLIESPIISGSQVKFWCLNGTDGQTYDLTVKVLTTNGFKLEEDLKIVVEEVRHA